MNDKLPINSKENEKPRIIENGRKKTIREKNKKKLPKSRQS